MVALLIAGLVVAVGVWLYLRSTNAAGTPVTPGGGTGDTSQGTLGGIDFTAPGSASAAAAAAGATAYDPNDPASAQRRIDAINRAQILQAKADAQGITPEQDYQNHLAQDLAAQQKETQTIMDVSASRIAAASAAAAGAAAAAAAASANAAYSGASMPVPTLIESRRGVGHFNGGVSTPVVAPGTSKSTEQYVTAVLNSGPPSGVVVPPGMYWNYQTQSLQPAI